MLKEAQALARGGRASFRHRGVDAAHKLTIIRRSVSAYRAIKPQLEALAATLADIRYAGELDTASTVGIAKRKRMDSS